MSKMDSEQLFLRQLEERVKEYDGSVPVWWEQVFSGLVAVHPWRIIMVGSLVLSLGLGWALGSDLIDVVSWLQGGI